MFTLEFWKAATERALKSVAQAIIILATGDAVFNVLDFEWQNALGVGLGAAVLSYLTSMLSAGVTSQPGPSITNSEVLPPVTH